MSKPLRVVTLPPGLSAADAEAFAADCARRGADLLEVRNDLHPDSLDLSPLQTRLRLLVSARGRPLDQGWVSAAAFVDLPIEDAAFRPDRPVIFSHHAAAPLPVEAAVELWRSVPLSGAGVKHVEPLGEPSQGGRLLELASALRPITQGPVTVLATGSQALAFRAVLAELNSFDYLAEGASYAAAPGQRLLDDAVRAARAGAATPGQRLLDDAVGAARTGAAGLRLGILGTRIGHSRSPRIHPQPFDRIELPPTAEVGALVDALKPWYRGFAVTRPFKKSLARHLRADADAVNTLYSTPAGWGCANTDQAGAEAVMRKLAAPRVTALGGGGVAPALVAAAKALGVSLAIVRREDVVRGVALSGPFIWTWPEEISPPQGLALKGADVVVIAYGSPGRTIRAQVEAHGGRALLYGARWFVAQARAQRRLWDSGG